MDLFLILALPILDYLTLDELFNPQNLISSFQSEIIGIFNHL
jgi:hypothetical protein